MTFRKISFSALLFAAFFCCSTVDALARDEWLQVRSKNFFLIGDASEKDIRKVATKLEQFRETFRLLFGDVSLNAGVPTNVVVFKSDSSYKPFKPKRADGKIDSSVAGYFQPGEDVNYITLSTQGTDTETFGTIFHEYVHFVLDAHFGRSEVPPWFNEGLAEYYQTFEIEKDQNVKLGMLQSNHVFLLRDNPLIPLKTFFGVTNRDLLQDGRHSKSIFYAQSWALVHYLTLNGKAAGMKKFLGLTMSNRPPEQAFQESFGIGYAEMEKELRKYVGQGSFKYIMLPLKTKLVFDAEMHTAPLSEAESNAYLGDLLFHTNRLDDAEPFLRAALSLKPDLALANTALGMVKMRQNKFDEAKGFLEKAVAGEQRSHIPLFRYAYLLSRKDLDELGYVHRFEDATAAKMRGLLKKAIELSPTFTESYELLAFINLVNDEQLDESAALLRQAIRYQPGNLRYSMRLAEVLLRLRQFTEAAAIAQKIARTTDEADLRTRAAMLADEVRQREAVAAQQRPQMDKDGRTPPASGPSVGDPVLVRRKHGEEKPSLEEMANATASAVMRGINQSLRPLASGEKRVFGKISKIDCTSGTVVYSVRSDAESFQLASKDFRALIITTFVPETGDADVGCESDLSSSSAVITYRLAGGQGSRSRGELVALEFVPANFRFIDLAAEPKSPTFVIEEVGPPRTEAMSVAERRRAITDAIKESLRKAGPGERREIGFIERTECTDGGAIVHIRTAAGMYRLTNSSETMFMRAYTAETEHLQMGCGTKPIDLPVVFIFKPDDGPNAERSGVLLSLEFVPKGFTLGSD